MKEFFNLPLRYWLAIATVLFVGCTIIAIEISFVAFKTNNKITPVVNHCPDYANYDAILRAFHNGNRALDADGDGIPCENRK